MATEDKFADEMLTDDELENVAGGTCNEMADDSRFLNVLLAGKPGQFDDDELDKVAGGWCKLYSVDDPSLQKLNQNPYEPGKYSVKDKEWHY